MFKKHIIFLTAIALILSACTPKEKVSDIDEAGNYIVPEKQIKLSVWDLGLNEENRDIKEDVVESWLTEKTNVKVTEHFGNEGKNWTDRLAQLVMDGALPHIVNVPDSEGMRQFKKLEKIKRIYKLSEEEIKTYAPNLWEKTPKEYWEYLRGDDGSILGIPYDIPLEKNEPFKGFEKQQTEYIRSRYKVEENSIFPQKGSVLWIRDDILEAFYPEAMSYSELESMLSAGEKIGDRLLDVPIHTTEEYIKFMYDIAQQEYKTDNGKRIYAFGYGGTDSRMALNYLGADMYGYKNYDYYTSWTDGKISLMADDDIIRQALKTQNAMINDGVINRQSVGDDEKDYKKKVLSGQYAIIVADFAGGGENINRELKENGKTFRYRPFVTNIESEYKPYKSEELWGGAICLLNTLNESRVHQVLNWINVQYTDEFDEVRSWGSSEDALYIEGEDGKRLFKGDNLSRYFILEDKSVIESEDELMGLSGNNFFSVAPDKASKWSPAVMYDVKVLSPNERSGFGFKNESEYVLKTDSLPDANIRSSIYSSIPEVHEFLAECSDIEKCLKDLLLQDEEDFDEQWEEFTQRLNRITDIPLMEQNMTAAAKGE